MGMGFAPTWLRQVSPLLHKTTLTTGYDLVLGTSCLGTSWQGTTWREYELTGNPFEWQIAFVVSQNAMVCLAHCRQ